MTKQSSDEFAFRKQDAIGVNDAEDDKTFLFNCFINTGDYDSVLDFNNSRCLILGRTGAGKTALLTMLKEDKRQKNTVITIDPEALAMQHISNSSIVKSLFDLDIDLNTFFKLLWRHELCVEIFTHHFKVTETREGEDILEQLRNKFKKTNPRHLRALNYLEEWKDNFWKQDNNHVVEVLNRTESELGANFGAVVGGVGAKVSGKKTISSEQKQTLKQQAQSVVDNVQIKEVTQLIGMLNEVIEDQQKQYYIVIDKLDEGWVNNDIRYRLIKALIETIRDINRLDNLKPLVVLRQDLLGHVFDVTQDSGFQEEKFASLYLPVTWTRKELTELLDERINYSFCSRYRKKHYVTHEDILPSGVRGEKAIDYILNRTLMRPRDAIDFFNICISEATESPLITEQMVLDAERIYSRDRLDSLYFEWNIDFPGLKEWVQIIRKKSSDFFVGSLKEEYFKEKALKYAVENTNTENDQILNLCNDYAENRISLNELKNHLIYIFFLVGLTGLTLEGHQKPIWSYEVQKNVSSEDITDSTFVTVHPCFRSALNLS